MVFLLVDVLRIVPVAVSILTSSDRPVGLVACSRPAPAPGVARQMEGAGWVTPPAVARWQAVARRSVVDSSLVIAVSATVSAQVPLRQRVFF